MGVAKGFFIAAVLCLCAAFLVFTAAASAFAANAAAVGK
jgi:hypothetical protein